MKRVFAFIIIGLLMAGCKTGNDLPEGFVEVLFDASTEAFPNPMKGFRPARYLNDTTFPAGEYVSTIHHLIKYTDLETSASDTAQKIINWSNELWANLPAQNIKVIPRVIMSNPGIGEFFPTDLDSSDNIQRWLSAQYKQRIAAFIVKLGAAWDNDPRVAAIESGIWGYWGEHHIWSKENPGPLPGNTNRIPADIQKVMGDAFAAAFKNKQVQVRYPNEFRDYQFGYYWDSFAIPSDNTGDLIIQRNTWREVMNSGEIAYDVGSASIVGAGPDETLSSTQYTNHVIDWVERTHTSSLGWVANYTQNNQALSANAARLQKAMGYRFVVQSAVYNQTIAQGGKLSLEFNVTNTGNAPFYYQWPVEVSLLNAQKNPVWKANMSADIRTWLPGGDIYTVRGEFSIPDTLSQGTYTLAIAVLDPAGNRPSLRFANKNYYNGGRMPLATIGIGQEPETNSLGTFDSLYNDHSLSYTP